MERSNPRPQLQLATVAKHLTDTQAEDLVAIARVFISPTVVSVPKVSDPIFNKESATYFGDVLKLHHCFSDEPFTKDKFEHLLKSTLERYGFVVKSPTTNNPGEDLTIDGVPVSLKTQADQSIELDYLQIHKFMELGKGDWGNSERDIRNLLEQFLEHISRYQRIFVLRAITNPKVCKANNRDFTDWEYELVEIPKSLLEAARHGEITISTRSKLTSAKPATCAVFETLSNGERARIYNLYFDGGGERKLKLTSLRKDHCKVHGTWKFRDPKSIHDGTSADLRI